MDNWLKSGFLRKTPVVGTSDKRSDNRSELPQFSLDESHAGNEGVLDHPARLKASSRVSSIIGSSFTGRPNPPSIPRPPSPDIFVNIDPDALLVAKPNIDAMAEGVKVIFMNKNSFTDIPNEYYSSVLHVLEAYQDKCELVAKLEEAINDLKQGQAEDVKHMEDLATQWEQKENNYKKELKNLEVLLARTEGGLEQVALARSKSTVHDSKRIGITLGSGIGTIKTRAAAREAKIKARSNSAKESQGPNFADEECPDEWFRPRSQTFPPVKTSPTKSILSPSKSKTMSGTPPLLSKQIARLRGSLDSSASVQSMPDPSKPVGEVLSTREDKRPTQSSGEFGQFGYRRTAVLEKVVPLDSASEVNSSVQSGSPTGSRRGLGISEKPLPEIPGASHTGYSDSVPIIPEPPPLPPQMAFSFHPGDDADILAHNARTRRGAADSLSEFDRTPPLKTSKSEYDMSTLIEKSLGARRQAMREPPSPIKTGPSSPRRSRPTAMTTQPTTPDQKRAHEHELSHASSTSSIVTAVRHNSGMNSASVSQDGSQIARRTFDTRSGSDTPTPAISVSATSTDYTVSPQNSPSFSQQNSARSSVSGVEAKRNSLVSGQVGSQFGRGTLGRTNSTQSNSSEAAVTAAQRAFKRPADEKDAVSSSGDGRAKENSSEGSGGEKRNVDLRTSRHNIISMGSRANKNEMKRR